MTFQVKYSRQAERDLSAAYRWVADRSPLNAARWLGRLEASVEKLAAFPGRNPLAGESAAVGLPVRQFVHPPYRVLYMVENRTVTILHIRHGRRTAAAPEELLDDE